MSEQYRLDGINENTYDLLFQDYDDVLNEINYENTMAFVTIDKFTKLQEEKLFLKSLKMYKKNEIIDLNKITFDEQTKQYKYQDNDYVINFDIISHYITDEDLERELTSDERYGECHIKALNLSPAIKNSRIITGYITVLKSKVLHSVVEYECNGEIIVLDWTRNLKIPKDQYIKLTDFVELSSLDGSKVIKDFEKIVSNISIGIKPYVVFRDEIINDIKRNPEMFKTDENIKKIIQDLKYDDKKASEEENQPKMFR